MHLKLSLGVKDFQFALSRSCAKRPQQKIIFTVSFVLEGDFLPAALEDNLLKTIDYDALTRQLATSLNSFDCSNFLNIKPHLKQVMHSFSDLISGGYASFSLQCHDTFFDEIHEL